MEYLAQNGIWKPKNVTAEMFPAIARWFGVSEKIDTKQRKRPRRHQISAHIRRDIGLPVEAFSPPSWYWDLWR